MPPKFFIGADISKETIDFAVLRHNEVISQVKIENTEKAVRKYLISLSKDFKCSSVNSLLCAENMGIYCTFLCKVSFSRKLRLCLESPLRIKRSLGIQRGKNDAIDAVRIATYAKKNFASLAFWVPPRQIIEQLKLLNAARHKLLKIKIALTVTTKIRRYFLTDKQLAEITNYSILSVTAVAKDVTELESKIDALIASDPRLNRLKEIIVSIPLLGKKIATELIIETNEFLNFESSKKLASYCGVAPFQWSSGTSIKGRPRVSQIANKRLKSLLHLPAMSAAKNTNNYFSEYYKRKSLEGKNKMVILNAIKNIFLRVVFRCVKTDTLYHEIKYGKQPGDISTVHIYE